MPGGVPDGIIGALAGIAPGSALDRARGRRLQARAQASHDPPLHPADPSGMQLVERFAVAALSRVAGSVTGSPVDG